MLESRNIHSHASDDGYSAEDTDKSPESNENITHGWGRLRPVSQEVGDGTRKPSPWRSWNVWVEISIDVEVPSMILGPRTAVWRMIPHGEDFTLVLSYPIQNA